MMVPTLLQELRQRDVRLWAEGDQLRCNAPAGVLTPALRQQIQLFKGDIVEFLRSVDTLAHQERAIVPLQPHGDRVPVFAVAGHNGDVFCYRALARELGSDQPFFGLQPPGLDGHSPPLTSVSEIASFFAGQIQAFRPRGPYVIAGYCAGGAIAFELARQLHRQGACIPFVALFACPYPSWFRPLPQLAERLAQGVLRSTAHAWALLRLQRAERTRFLRERLLALRAVPKEPDEDPVLLRRRTVETVSLRAVRRYTPGFFEGRVCMFLPGRPWALPGFSTRRWSGVAAEAHEYRGPEGGDRDALLREPHVAVVAEIFRRSRERLGER